MKSNQRDAPTNSRQCRRHWHNAAQRSGGTTATARYSWSAASGRAPAPATPPPGPTALHRTGRRVSGWREEAGRVIRRAAAGARRAAWILNEPLATNHKLQNMTLFDWPRGSAAGWRETCRLVVERRCRTRSYRFVKGQADYLNGPGPGSSLYLFS